MNVSTSLFITYTAVSGSFLVSSWPPGVEAEAIEHRLQIHLADSLQRADEAGVHSEEVARETGLDVARVDSA